MKALPLWQPWASLVMLGSKQVETRSWPPPDSLVGQRIAIHATKGGLPKGEEADLLLSSPFARALGDVRLNMPRGALIGTVLLVRFGSIDARNSERLRQLNPTEHAFGDFTPGRWAWVLADAQECEPIPCTGHQRLFDVPDELIPQLEGQGALFT